MISGLVRRSYGMWTHTSSLFPPSLPPSLTGLYGLIVSLILSQQNVYCGA